MKVGVPSEIKNHEYRVALTPAGVRELTAHGHGVFVQKGAGAANFAGAFVRQGRGQSCKPRRRSISP